VRVAPGQEIGEQQVREVGSARLGFASEMERAGLIVAKLVRGNRKTAAAGCRPPVFPRRRLRGQ
jgi:hypothetical protein